MKKLLFLILLLSNFFGYAQYTLIPDVNFEKALISRGMDNGIPDGQVLTANISGLTDLYLYGENITDLTGIQSFLSLKTLECGQNLLTSIDISKNTFLEYLDCSQNKLTTLDVSKNIKLTKLTCTSNLLTNLDVSKNSALIVIYCNGNLLTNIDVSKNAMLLSLFCDVNYLINLDLSNNKTLVGLNCSYNNLTNLNLKNGNNIPMSYTGLSLKFNPNLTCIQVDNAAYSNANVYWSPAKDATASYSENCNAKVASINPPVITATGNQIYCPGTSLNIVESVSITFDPLEPTTDAVYIQVSSGYIFGQDLLTLAGFHPTVSFNWIQSEGKLKLFSSTGGKIPYADFESAIADVQFSNSSASPSGIRNFSISIGQANYLPSTGHYYEFVSDIGITWTAAKAAAAARNYYGIQGYLATISAADEAQITGAQSTGAGWIGGSDDISQGTTEGVWKWVTGPEAGTIFWNGTANGSSPNFAFWNTQEPNNLGIENFAHITALGVGITGSWNDMSNTGDINPTSLYHPQGYIVEYGGMPGDPILQISGSTKMTISQITTTTPPPICGSGTVVLQASTTTGAIDWYDASIGGNFLGTGNSYTTPLPINTTTTYYVDNGCPNRIPIIATVNTIPTITSAITPVSRCGAGSVTLQASSDIGIINWYSNATGGSIAGTGTSFTIPNIATSATYYAEAFNNGCSNGTRTSVDIKVYTPPVVTNQEVTLCQSSTVELDAGVPGMLYLWSPTGETTSKITVSTSGVYTVAVTSPAPENCTSTKKITVVEHNIPEIDRVVVNETTVVIYLKKEEAYFEYSVDGINYQSSNVFFNVQSGLQTAYLREINLCSNDSQTFIVLIAPKFFTPNGDTYNDFWEVKGLINYPQAEVSIFDRYGKLISVLNINKLTWDGMLNKYPMPADDYWYVLKIDETKPEKRGHFSLKR
jgi:gliding motility-associated-like protein